MNPLKASACSMRLPVSTVDEALVSGASHLSAVVVVVVAVITARIHRLTQYLLPLSRTTQHS